MSHRSYAWVVIAAAAAAGVACGSRTGLLNTDPPVVVGKDAGPDAPVVTCTPGTFKLDRAAAQLMFVIDRSGSMRFLLDGTDPDPNGTLPPRPDSRWRILQRGLDPVLTTLEGRIEIGAKFFPDPFDPGGGSASDACIVQSTADVPPKKATAADILGVFDATRPLGGTPTADAIKSAVTYLKNGARRVISRYMVLATDGAPNCNDALDFRTCVCTQVDVNTCRQDPQDGPSRCLDDNRTVQVIQQAADTEKIPTFVIGLGASDPVYARTLDRMAVAGARPRTGTPRYYEALSAAELEKSLTEIQASISECTYVTPSAPTDPNAITIEINGARINRDTTRQDGWDWVDQNYGQVALFGSACDAALRGGEGTDVKGTVSCDK